ncbi:hypothetical protein PFFCH_03050 [Plasmodium falciparum FCH/4]|uniref:Translation initiation factor eIF2B subunit gamma n=1 Tax=Plasmodium falciparum FCH/4 TaxID=1036724 RepID=A0A024VL73_PLAFA|nr:hypothetical protein PFFCH_03050 [Plasmodium falciparum FCH/4]
MIYIFIYICASPTPCHNFLYIYHLLQYFSFLHFLLYFPYYTVDLFRGENAICAILLLENNQPSNDKKKKEITDEYVNLENNVWVCIDKNSKVVSIKDSLSMKENGKMKISKVNLLFHKNFVLKTDLLDSHVYIFKHYVLEIMEQKKNKFSSIKYDLIPYLVKIQNTSKAAEYSKGEFKYNMYNTLIEKYEGDDEIEEGKRENLMLDIINNHTLIWQYIYIYIYFFFFFFLQFKDCIISSHFDHEENILLKKSILGKNVTIKKNSSINRSILMDNITIHEKCVIQNSIICDNVVIEENCKVNII